MNILNVTTMVGLRGGDLQMYTVYKLLKDSKEFNQFILCPENADLAEMCRQDNAQCHFYKKNRWRVFNAIAAIIKVCKKEKINLIHIHDSTALNYVLIALKFLPADIKVVLSRKRNNRIRKRKLNYWKYSHPRINKIISVSKAVEDIFEPIIKDRERLVLIYDAIDVSKFENRENKHLLHKEYNWPADVKIIGNIAGLTPQKDIFTFIDTAKLVLNSGKLQSTVKFVVVGTGVLREQLEAYTKQLGLENHVVFTGFRKDAADLLPEFDCFLMSSVTEGLPLTIYEAFACKIPVVSTDAGGIAEVLKHEATGLIANVKDSNTLAENVLRTLNDPELASTLSKNAFALVKKDFDLPVMKANYHKFYHSLFYPIK